MNRETLKKIDRFLTFGDIKPRVDETDCYYITDKAMQKVIDGFSKELLELHRIITMNRLIEVRKRAGQVEPEVKPATCENCKHFVSYRVDYEDDLEPNDCGFCKHPKKKLDHTNIEDTCEMHEPSKLSV